MFPSGQQVPFQPTPLAIQDAPTMMQFEKNEISPMAKDATQNGAFSHAEFALFNSKRIEDDLQTLGLKIKQHEQNLQFLKSQKSKLDESILDLQVILGKYHSSTTQRTENHDESNIQSEEIMNDQILQYGKSAAGIFCLMEIHHGTQASQLTLTKDVLGIVAKLGKVVDEDLSRLLSEYLGVQTMLAVVCKTYEGVKELEIYKDGLIDKTAGLHGLGASIGRAVEGRFDVICLENLRPYVGQFVAGDQQRRLDLLKPRLPSGECPPGFLGFAVNMINLDPTNLLCATVDGYGLRETLFYCLFGRLQVYKTRADMVHALPCISDGAVSLDGGMIRSVGVFSLGSRDEINVRFAKPSATSRLPDNYVETEKQVNELRWKKDKLKEDMKRELVLLDHAKFNFGRKKEEFVKFMVQSSSYTAQMMSPR